MIFKAIKLIINLFFDTLKASVKSFIGDGCFTLSSSISYYFLMSVIPFAALSIIIFNISNKIISFIYKTEINFSEVILENVEHIVPFVSQEWISDYIINPGAIRSFTIIGVAFLPFISAFIFNTLETSYRKIFKLPSRSIFKTSTIYPLITITLILLIFIANFVFALASEVFFGIIDKSNYIREFYIFFKEKFQFLKIDLISTAIIFFFYLGTIKIFLNIKIRFIYRVICAFVFFILWVSAKYFFGIYITKISNISLIYGSLTSLIIILTWIYYSAITLLFSIEILYNLHINDPIKKVMPLLPFEIKTLR